MRYFQPGGRTVPAVSKRKPRHATTRGGPIIRRSKRSYKLNPNMSKAQRRNAANQARLANLNAIAMESG